MTIETEYMGHRITYNEDGNLWSCWSLRFEASSLAALKQKISKHDADTRRVDRVKALKVPRWDCDKFEAVHVTLIVDDKECWISKKDGREKVAYQDLVFDTPEIRQAWSAYVVAAKEAEKAKDTAEKMKAKIPRLSRAALLELKVQAAEDAA